MPGRLQSTIVDTSTMIDKDFCCSGDCAQGDKCPRFRAPQKQRDIGTVSMYALLILAVVIAGIFS